MLLLSFTIGAGARGIIGVPAAGFGAATTVRGGTVRQRIAHAPRQFVPRRTGPDKAVTALAGLIPDARDRRKATDPNLADRRVRQKATVPIQAVRDLRKVAGPGLRHPEVAKDRVRRNGQTSASSRNCQRSNSRR